MAKLIQFLVKPCSDGETEILKMFFQFIVKYWQL